jgi:hypothetical protein
VTRPTLLAVLAGLTGVAIAVFAVLRTLSVEQELARVRTAPAPPPANDALAAQVRRLEARIAALEARPQVAPAASAPAASAPAAAPPGSAPTADLPPPSDGGHDDPIAVMKDPKKRAERQQHIEATIEEYWRAWSSKHNLTDAQAEGLVQIQLEASRRKLDNQLKLTNGEVTQPAARADNQAATEEVRRKAQALLSPEQFAVFNAEKGAEWGSSYRKLREVYSKAGGGAPQP